MISARFVESATEAGHHIATQCIEVFEVIQSHRRKLAVDSQMVLIELEMFCYLFLYQVLHYARLRITAPVAAMVGWV